MDPKHNPKLKEAIALEGFLGKQSPDMFHRYQQRYCKFLDGGLTFAYSDSKDSFAHGKINGQIPLKDVHSIVSEEKPKKFQVTVEGRVYKFEAHTVEEKAKWVDALNVCRDYAIKQEQHSQEQVMAIDSDIRFEEDGAEEAKPEGHFNPVGVITKTAKKLIVDTALKTGVTVVKTGVNVVGNVVGDKKPRTNEEYLKAKNLSDPLSQIDERILRSRLIMGYLLKETKEPTGMRLVDGLMNDTGMRNTIAQRWCFLISSKPIVFDNVDPTDEEILDNGKLPFDIEEDVFYIYDDKCDDSKPLESVYLKDVIDVVVKKKATGEQNYRFRLDLGEKKVNMLTNNNTEMMKWVTAVQASRANLKEVSRSKLPTIKNLFWHYKIMHDEGEGALREKLNRDYERLVPAGDVMRADNIGNLIKIQQKVSDELIAIINACLAHKDQKTEVIQAAMEIYHESILTALKTYFKKNQSNLENRDIFEIIKFLREYRDRTKVFGDAFADPRITMGTAILSKIVGTRLLKTNLKTVKNIVKQDMDKEPEINGAGKAITNAPTDIFKVLNETFNILPLCNTKELAFALLESCSHTLEYFISGLGTIIDYYKTTPDQLAAFCNNTLAYNTSLKEFGKTAQELTKAGVETINQYFDERGLSKQFVSLGKKAYEKIAHIIFSSTVSDPWNKAFFLDITLQSGVKSAIEKVNHIAEKMHANFSSKIEAACLEKAVTFYVQAFLNSAEKKRFKADDHTRIVTKFEYDIRQFSDVFPNLKKNVIDNYTKPISNFQDFLVSNYSFLPLSVQSLKEEYGTSIKWSTIELLIKLRNDNIEKEEKADFFRNCEDIYKTTQRKAEKAKNFNVFKHLDQGSDTSTAPESLRTLESDSSFIDDASSDTSGSGRRRSRDDSTKSRASVLNLEGYLEVEKDEFLSNVGANFIAHLKFETKYFNLKRDILYFYKDKTSESAQGSYKIKEVADFGPQENEPKMFYMVIKTSKEGEAQTVRFKAATIERRDAWLAGFRVAKALPDNDAMIELSSADVNLFKDMKPLFVDIEEMPSLVFPPAPSPPVVTAFITRPAAASVNSKAVEKPVEKPIETPKGTERRRSFHIEEPVLPSLSNAGQKKCCDSCSMF